MTQLDGIFHAYEMAILERASWCEVRVLAMHRLAEHVGKPLQHVREQARRRGWEFLCTTNAGNERWRIRRGGRNE